MRMESECVQCILNSTMEIFRDDKHAVADERRFLRDLLDTLQSVDIESPPPEYARQVYKVLYEHNKIEDNYAENKAKSTEIALNVLPKIQAVINTYAYPFEAAVRFAIAGNIIDYGTNRTFDLNTVEARLMEVMEQELDIALVRQLEQDMKNAKHILYMLDNCGEAVLDRLLTEPFKEKITLGVRGKKVLNDVTKEDLAGSGFANYRVITTGDGTPGVSLKYSSPEFMQVLNAADLIIAKGQGNYETLDEYGNANQRVYHLFRLKCPVVMRLFKAENHGAIKIICH